MPREAARVFRDMLLAVKVLHDNGWLHGDLKPPNIDLIGTRSALEPTPGSGGTLNYIAPERELNPYDHSVDIWGLGCVGYELTYGRHP